MFFNGPEAFTPDADFLLGETDVPGFWVAAGGCAHGLAGAGGIGKVMGEWIVDGRPEWDVWPLDLRRFGRQYASQAYTLARSYEALSQYYDIKYPGEEKLAGRPLRVSPVYARHRELGAAFGEKGGWERVNWYESNAAGGDESLRPRGWAGENWSPAIEVEARAARESAALFDQSWFSKLEVLGPGALAFLERLCANRIDRPVGTIVYTQLLNARGGIEADLSVTRRAADRFLLVTGTAFGNHDRAWLERNAPRDGSVYVNDVTSAYACLCLWGPRARDVLQPLTKSPLGLPVHDLARDLRRKRPGDRVAGHLRRRARLGAVLPDRVRAAALGHARRRRRRDAGRLPRDRRARLEKGYRAWASDLNAETTPDEAGLAFAVKRDKGDFIGRDARSRGQQQTLVCLVLDDPRAIALGSEPVRAADGEIVGRVTSGGYGYAVDASIAFAYVPLDNGGPGTRLAGRHLRRLGERGGARGASVRPEGRADPRMKYARIVAHVEEAIAAGELAPGDRLPAERELAAEHGVSRMTVRQALQTLESRGLLRRAIGRSGGSFVAQPKLERDLGTFSGLSEQLRRQGVEAGARVLSARAAHGSIEIVRIRLADDEPLALERSSFPADRFAGLLALDLTGSLYELLDEHFDAAPVRAVERIEPVLADAEEAEALGLPAGAPLMLVDRTAYDAAGVVVETARDVFRGDRTSIVAWTSELREPV